MLSGCIHQEKAEPKEEKSFQTKEVWWAWLKKYDKKWKKQDGYFQVEQQAFCDQKLKYRQWKFTCTRCEVNFLHRE